MDGNYRLPEEQKFEVLARTMCEDELVKWCESGAADWQTQDNMQLIKACVLSDVAKIKELLGERSYCKIIEAQYNGYCKFPLHLLTQYSRLIWECWGTQRDIVFISQMLERTEAMERFWMEYYDWVQMPKINWKPCCDFMESLYLEDDDILQSAVDKYGHRAIDVELFRAMGIFDFDKVEALLKEGANPNRWLLSPPNEEPQYYEWNALMDVWNEAPDSAFVDDFQEAVSAKDEWDIVSTIFHAAAYANMFKILKRYGYDPSEMSRL